MAQSGLSVALLLVLLQMRRSDCKMEIISSVADIPVGSTHIMLCKAGAEGDIVWLRGDTKLENEEGLQVEHLDETTSKITITQANMSHAGLYTCECDFDSGLSDKVSFQLFVYDGPSFRDTPLYHEVLEGQEAVLPCLAFGRPTMEVRWLRGSKPIHSDGGSRLVVHDDNSLHISAVTRQDSGTYECQASIKGSVIHSKNLQVSLSINVPPTVLLKEKVVSVEAGPNNVSLICLVDGQPKPNITWTTPKTSDPSRHRFNSDGSALTVVSVSPDDAGDYVCTAKNKISEKHDTMQLHVSAAAQVFLSEEQRKVLQGESVSVSCNVTGHPKPRLVWTLKTGQALGSVGRVRVSSGFLLVDNVTSSDGGVYSCMAISQSGNSSRTFTLHTQPGPPQMLSIRPGASRVHITIETPPIQGGTPITSYALQWRRNPADKWEETTVQASDHLVLHPLKPFTTYLLRLAAINSVGRGTYSLTHTVRALGDRQPDIPYLLFNQMQVEGNRVIIPLKQSEEELKNYNLKYKQKKEGAEWKEKQLSSNISSILLEDLAFGADYLLKLTAVNDNGPSDQATLNITVPVQLKTKSGISKGGVVGVVFLIFLILLLAVDAACCYSNRCGLLMLVYKKLIGPKVAGLKTLEEGDVATNGEVNLCALSTGGNSFSVQQEKLSEVTCDKAPLTK